MPELPEVETVVRGLRDNVVGRTITTVWHDWDNTIATPSPDELHTRLPGHRIESLWRRGKYIVANLSNQEYLIVHLKMTGRLYVAQTSELHDADRWVHFKVGLDDGNELRFSDSRKFGKVYFVNDLNQVLGKLGPEPLEDTFTIELFRQQLSGRTRQIKALLLDQSFVAGVGNIYADEALFLTGVSPTRHADSLNQTETETLFSAIQEVLEKGIRYQGASVNWYRTADGGKGSSQDHFFVYGREGLPCEKCGASIEKIRVAQRGTHYCPTCQD